MKQEDKFNQECGCTACALNEKCSHFLSWDAQTCAPKGFEEVLTECIEDVIRKVLNLSDDADRAFKESYKFMTDVEKLRRQQQPTELLPEERVKYIKDHWKNIYYLHLIRTGKGLLKIKI